MTAPNAHVQGRHGPPFKTVLFVCVGNICRSPIAEHLLRHALRHTDITVGSAGLAALTGQAMDPTAAELLREHGVNGDKHVARQLVRDSLHGTELIIAMQKGHVAHIAHATPEASGKVFLLTQWDSREDIPDPYRQQRPAFEHVFALIQHSIQRWLPHLGGSQPIDHRMRKTFP
jgi:protein-tyrosine phosphatase